MFSGEHSLGSLGLSIQFKSSIKLHWWHFKLCDVSEMRNQIEFEIVSKQIIDYLFLRHYNNSKFRI